MLSRQCIKDYGDLSGFSDGCVVSEHMYDMYSTGRRCLVFLTQKEAYKMRREWDQEWSLTDPIGK